MVLLPGGILEGHGPYLPSFADGYGASASRDDRRGIAADPDEVLVFPVIPLGVAAANEIGGKFTFDGSYSGTHRHLGAVFMDLATELGEEGFAESLWSIPTSAQTKAAFLIRPPTICNDTYGGQMVHLAGLMPVFGSYVAASQKASEAERAENGFGVHADLIETSVNLFLRPDLVAGG